MINVFSNYTLQYDHVTTHSLLERRLVEAWDRFPFLLFYDQLHTETTEKKDAYEKELMENQFVSLEEYLSLIHI